MIDGLEKRAVRRDRDDRVARARRRAPAREPRAPARPGQPPDTDLASQRHVVETFIAALRRGDVEGLIAILDPEVVGRAGDDTGNVREVRGARTWASGAVAFAQLANRMAPALIDGSVGLVMAPKDRLFRALRFTFEGDRITRAEVIADRARLDALDIAAIEWPAPTGNSSSP